MSLNEIDPLAEGAGAQAPVEPKVARSGPVQKREPLYFVVILLLIADIVLGLGLAVFGDRVMEFRPMAVGGLGLAGLGLGILAYFVLFGSGKTKR